MNSPRLRDSNRWISDAVIHPASMGTGGYGIDGDHDGLVDVYDPATPSRQADIVDELPFRNYFAHGDAAMQWRRIVDGLAAEGNSAAASLQQAEE